MYVELSEKFEKGNKHIEELQHSFGVQEAVLRDYQEKLLVSNSENMNLKEKLLQLDEVYIGLTNANETLVRALSDLNFSEVERDKFKVLYEEQKLLSCSLVSQVTLFDSETKKMKLLLEDAYWNFLADISILELTNEKKLSVEIDNSDKLKHEILELTTSKRQLEESISSLRERLDSVHDANNDAKSLLAFSEKEVIQIKSLLASSNSEVLQMKTLVLSRDEEVACLKNLAASRCSEVVNLHTEFSKESGEISLLLSKCESSELSFSDFYGQGADTKIRLETVLQESYDLKKKYKELKNTFDDVVLIISANQALCDLLNEETTKLKSEIFTLREDSNIILRTLSPLSIEIECFIDWHNEQMSRFKFLLKDDNAYFDADILKERPILIQNLLRVLTFIRQNLSTTFSGAFESIQILRRSVCDLKDQIESKDKLIYEITSAFAHREETTRVQLAASSEFSSSMLRMQEDIVETKSAILMQQKSDVKRIIDNYASVIERLSSSQELTQNSFPAIKSMVHSGDLGESIFCDECDADAVDMRCNLCENAETVIFALKTELRKSIEREEYLVSRLQLFDKVFYRIYH